MRTDGSFLPNGAGRFDASTSVLGTRPAGQPRHRSSSSPRQRMLSDVPDGHSRPEKKPIRAGASPARLEQQRHGGRRERGQRWATPAAVRRSRDDLPHTRHDERRCGRGRGSSSPARKRVTKVDRQGVAAGDCSPITASASRLAERGLRSARSRCPTSSRSALARVQQTSAPPSAGEQRQRLRHRGGCIRPEGVTPAP